MTSGPIAPATLPPPGLAGLDPSWSRLVVATGGDAIKRTWHVLDNRVDQAAVTLLCIHGNPTWSYLWRDLVARAPAGVRVVAIDQLDMGYSERTGTVRRLEQRIDDLGVLTAALDLSGPVVAVAHDWGGPIALGWAQRHREQLAGVVLMNTAVHQPADSPAPRLIRTVRSKAVLERLCVKTAGFIVGTLRLARHRLPKPVRIAYHAPYRSSDRRRAIATFVADIPLESDHPSNDALQRVAAGLADMRGVPALLLWGPADPVFSDLYLGDLQHRLPQADVHRFVGAGHLVSEDADIAQPIFEWVSVLDGGLPVAEVEGAVRPPMWAELDRRAGDAAVAVVEMAGDEEARSITFAELAAEVRLVAAGLVACGIRKGDRVALLVPPGIDLTVCLYACWRLGAVVVIADAGLGAAGMGKALQSAAPEYLIGVTKAMAAARSLRWPGKRISVDEMTPIRRSALGVWATLDEVRSRGKGHPLPEPPGDSDVAAVVFTSGATGPAKGVTYRHHQAQAQRDALMRVYAIGPDDRLVAAFAPFALYGAAMGITSVVPDMEVTAPGTLRAGALAGAVAAVDATLVFASPAALTNVVATGGDLTPSMRVALSGVRLLMSAGAPVSAAVLRKVAELVPNAELHTPYGMTEVLPVADISLAEIEAVGTGDGVCVGFPIEGVEVAISSLQDDGRATGRLTGDHSVRGEVCIRASHTKDDYDKLWVTQRASSQPAGWHRSGDIGHLDTAGRLWIEGRMIHLITTAQGVVTPVGLEHAAEVVHGVARAAAVGVGPSGTQLVVVVVALRAGPRTPQLADEELAARIRAAVPVDVAAVLTVSELPVDQRHNSKIDRTAIAAWAEGILAGGRMRRL